MNQSLINDLQSALRQVPDFPKPGINFYDITTALQDGELFKRVISALTERYQDQAVDAVVAIESRGFILGGAVASNLGCAFIPVRKPNKLPWKKRSVTYDLEYGSDTLEIHEDALSSGQRVVVVDDLIATGGTVVATLDLLKQFQVEILELAFLIELAFLGAREKMANVPVFSFVVAND